MDTKMDVFIFYVVCLITIIIWALLNRRRRGGKFLSSETDSYSIMETGSNTEPKSYTAENESSEGRGHSEIIPFHLTDNVVSVSETTIKERAPVSEMQVQRFSDRNIPRNKLVLSQNKGRIFIKDRRSKRIVMANQSCQTDSLNCINCDARVSNSMSAAGITERSSLPERNIGALSSERDVAEEVVDSSTRTSDGVDGSSEAAANNAHTADSNVSATVPAIALRTSAQQTDLGSDSSHTNQQADYTSVRDPDIDTDGLANASDESIDGSVTRMLNDLDMDHPPSSLGSHASEDSGLPSGHEEPDSSMYDEAFPHPQRNVAECSQSAPASCRGLDTILEETSERNITAPSEEDEDRMSPLPGWSARSNREAGGSESNSPGESGDDSGGGGGGSVNDNALREPGIIYEAGHFVSSAFHAALQQFHVAPQQRPVQYRRNASVRHSRCRVRMPCPTQVMVPNSLAALSLSQVCHNMSTPAFLPRNLTYRIRPLSRHPAPVSLPQPPAYAIDPPQYTPDDLPPAYALIDPIVSQTETLVSETASADISDLQVTSLAENAAQVDSSTGSEQDPGSAGAESTQLLHRQEPQPSEGRPSITVVREVESHPPSSATNQVSERRDLSPESGTDSPARENDTGRIVERGDQKDAFSEQSDTSDNTDSPLLHRRGCRTRCKRRRTETSPDSSSADDTEQSDTSPGRSPRTESSREPTENYEVDIALSQPSQTTGVTDSTPNRDEHHVSSAADRPDAEQEFQRALARRVRRSRRRSRRNNGRNGFVFPIPFLNGPAFGRTFEEQQVYVCRRFGLSGRGITVSDDCTQSDLGDDESGTSASEDCQ